MGHPVLMISSQISGLLYINGRICAEINENERITVPISTQGTVYIELSPLVAGYMWLARKLMFVRGSLAPATDEERKNMYIVEWPGSVYDIDLMPEKVGQDTERVVATHNGDGWNLRLVAGKEGYLYIHDTNGRVQRHSMPLVPADGVFMLLHHQTAEQILVRGSCSKGIQFACILTRTNDHTVNVDVLTGMDIQPADGGSLRVINNIDDVLHHVKVETWVPSDARYVLGNSEIMWSAGGPRWPVSPQDTVMALMQAIKLELHGEAIGYIGMGLGITPDAMAKRVGIFDWCLPLKYALPGGVEPAIGLATLIEPNYAKVRAMRYSMQAIGGIQGTWKLVAYMCEGETINTESA